MKKSFIFAALAVAMVGCSQDEMLTSYATSDANAIDFKTYVPKATRGTAVNSATDLQTAGFEVFAFSQTTPAAQILGTSATDGAKIVYSSGAWAYDQESDKAYWADAAIDFYAVSPESLGTLTNGSLTKNFTSGTQTLVYEVPTVCSEQKDILYASVKNATKGDRDGNGGTRDTGAIKFQFEHALSQIVFKVKTEGKFEVDIEDISINAKKSATFTYSTAAWTAFEDPQLYSVGLTAPVTNIGNTETAIGDASNALLLIPQSLSKWATTKTSAQALDTHYGYLKISCKIRNNGYIYGSATEFKDIYMPIALGWTKGNKYTYTICFGKTSGAAGGAGFDDQGKPILGDLLITFEAAVTAWTDATASDVEL